MAGFRERLVKDPRPLLLDGGLGTMLQARGLPAGMDPAQFCIERPEVLRGVHADYAAAGADILLTCTFGGTSLKLPGDLARDTAGFNRRMAQIAREAADAAGRKVFVGGDMGPCGLFAAPLGEMSPLDMYALFCEQVRGLVAGGVDCIVIETQFDLAETRLAVAAVRAECELPVLVSMTFENGVSLTGSTPEIFAATMRNMGVDAVGCNCGLGPEQMAGVVETFLATAGLPVLAEPNAGLPELIDGETRFRLPPEPFAQATAEFVRKGVRLVGGCCGTTPDHIAALRRAVDSISVYETPSAAPMGLALTSRSALVRAGAGRPLCVIGERINPTGKKALTAELQTGAFTTALTFAEEQIALGAPVLDVNVGAPLVDEVDLLPRLVCELISRHTEPLSLDSSNPAAIAAGLPWHPGSALVNSINGDEGRDGGLSPMEALGPLCRQWGAPFILLPIRGRKLPVRAAERIAIIESMLEQTEALGIPRYLALVDVLALSVASKAEAAREGLETLRWCAANGLPTVMGLSNISFGLPARELVNSTYLAMSMGAGLSACIANPSSVRFSEARMAADVLLGADVGAERFVSGFSQWSAGEPQSAPGAATGRAAGASSTVFEAIVRGDKDAVIRLVDVELSAGHEAAAVVNNQMIPAITEVGNRYERREYFLPQLLRSAEAMQTAFAYVKPRLEKDGAGEDKPVIVVATVEGDIHDIGKNIVTLMLRNHGFAVVDLGKDVKAEVIVEAAVAHKAAVIGLSALMTTTMVRMEDTIKLVRERKLPIKIMVGGAVVTPAFAERIGADGTSADAVGAVRLAQALACSEKIV